MTPCSLLLCYPALTIAGFKTAATPAVLEGVGVSPEAALDKMRLLALLVLGSKAKGSAVPFADIQAALDIPLEQVRIVILTLFVLIIIIAVIVCQIDL
jgi:hypothetical protein